MDLHYIFIYMLQYFLLHLTFYVQRPDDVKLLGTILAFLQQVAANLENLKRKGKFKSGLVDNAIQDIKSRLLSCVL